jgi:N-acetylglutamate synthase-like GNAT family acetyltransferase
VLDLYEKRESKKEDVNAIQKLEVELIKKDFLIERERKELKNCKL